MQNIILFIRFNNFEEKRNNLIILACNRKKQVS